MSINGIFKTLLSVCVFVFLASFLAGIISVLIVLLLWVVTIYLMGRNKRHEMEDLHAKYSNLYILPQDTLVSGDYTSDEQTKKIKEYANSTKTTLPAKIDDYTLWFDVIVTVDSLIFVYLFDDSVYSVDSIDWNIVKQNLLIGIENRCDSEEYVALVDTKRNMICRYIIKSSQAIKDIVLTNDEIKKLISK